MANDLVIARDIRPSVLKRWIGDAEHIGYDIVDTAESLKIPMPPLRRAREAYVALHHLYRAREELADLIHQIEAALDTSASEASS